jgi:dynein light chain roadblock-type
MQQPTPSEETAALLARLSSRPGVRSTLILSRDTGAIVRSTGLLTAEDISEEAGGEASAPNGIGGTDTEGTNKGTRNADAVARLVWNFVKNARETTEELNGETDEVKLLRLRTRKNELVVVPDAKFLLVVVHDTPPA